MAGTPAPPAPHAAPGQDIPDGPHPADGGDPADRPGSAGGWAAAGTGHGALTASTDTATAAESHATPGMGPRTAGILAARTRQLADRGVAVPGAVPLPLMACAVGTETYGLPLAAILRVVPYGSCTPTPGMPPAMLGLSSHAGQVFIVLDLGAVLHGTPATAPATAPGPDETAPHLLLLRHGPRRFALRVGRALGSILAVPLPAQPGAAIPHGAVTGHAQAQAQAQAHPRLALAGQTRPPGIPRTTDIPRPAGMPQAQAGGGLIGLIDIGHLLRPYLPAAPSPTAPSPTAPSPTAPIPTEPAGA